LLTNFTETTGDLITAFHPDATILIETGEKHSLPANALTFKTSRETGEKMYGIAIGETEVDVSLRSWLYYECGWLDP
jgi:hypothetical protein